MAAVEFTRWFLALFFVGVAAFYAIRIRVAKRRIGSDPVFEGTPGTLHFATYATFRVFRALILGACVVRLLWPGLDPYLGTFDALWHPAILLAGDALLLGGFAVVAAINFYMGENWRSGTRAGDTTQLITTGPFAVSRNPMTICVIAGQTGLFLALPSLFTLVCLVVGVWAVVTQVGIEERLLRERYGAQWESYAARTPRWLRIKRKPDTSVMMRHRGIEPPNP